MNTHTAISEKWEVRTSAIQRNFTMPNLINLTDRLNAELHINEAMWFLMHTDKYAAHSTCKPVMYIATSSCTTPRSNFFVMYIPDNRIPLERKKISHIFMKTQPKKAKIFFFLRVLQYWTFSLMVSEWDRKGALKTIEFQTHNLFFSDTQALALECIIPLRFKHPTLRRNTWRVVFFSAHECYVDMLGIGSNVGWYHTDSFIDAAPPVRTWARNHSLMASVCHKSCSLTTGKTGAKWKLKI